MDLNQSVEVLEKELFELQQNLKALQEKGLPLYMKDDYLERELRKIKRMGLEAYKNERILSDPVHVWDRGGGATIELWERWFNKQ